MSSQKPDTLTKLSSFEEHVWLIDTFIIGTFGLSVNITIYISLRCILKIYKNRNENNENCYYLYALHTTSLSIIFCIFVFFLKMILNNNLLIPWNYSNNSNRFVSSIDSITNSI